MVTETDKLLAQVKEEIDLLAARITVDDETMKHLADLYSKIWIQAAYDPDNEYTEKLARELLPHIQAVNDKLHFKR